MSNISFWPGKLPKPVIGLRQKTSISTLSTSIGQQLCRRLASNNERNIKYSQS